jgi:hypothetical protein
MITLLVAFVACTGTSSDKEAGGDDTSADTAADVLPEPDMAVENPLDNPDFFSSEAGASRVDQIVILGYQDGAPTYAFIGYAIDDDFAAPMACVLGYSAEVRDTDIEWCDGYCDWGGTFNIGDEQELYGNCQNVDIEEDVEDDYANKRMQAGYDAVQPRGPSAEYHDVIMLGTGGTPLAFATSEAEGFEDGTSWAATDGADLWVYGRAQIGTVN